MTTIRKVSLLLLLTWACHLPVASGATLIVYHVTVNTSSLVSSPGNSAGPFSLDFQFNDGKNTGDGNNTVKISNVTYGAGGSASGTPPDLHGGASGSLFSGVTITDSGSYNDFTQEFTPGSLLSFDVTVPMINLGGSGDPDLFTFAILYSADQFQVPLPIPTTDPDSSDQLLTIILNPSNPLVATYMVDTSRRDTPPGIAAFEPNVVVVPEPNLAFFGLVLMGLFAGVRRNRAPSSRRDSGSSVQ